MLVACGVVSPGTAPFAGDTVVDSGPPDEWAWVAGGGGDLWVALPPWLQAFDTSGAVFANEPGVGQRLQLLAEGPTTVEPQPPAGGVERWLMERVALPAGPAIHLRRLDGAGTPLAWRMEAWAVDTSHGVAILVIDGPPGSWAGRRGDVRRIAELVRFDGPPGQ
jgi:hypothetical protein